MACKKFLLLLLLLPFLGWETSVAADVFAPNTHFEVCFTPNENCTALIVRQIDAARHSILVQSYTFTSYPITDALIRAKSRGVQVQVMLDKSQFKPPLNKAVMDLESAQVPLWSDNTVSIAHNKVMVFDNQMVETGSFNYTYSAQKYNAENVLIIESPTLAALYSKNWYRRMAISQKIASTPHTTLKYW